MNKKDALKLTQWAEDITNQYYRLLQFASQQRNAFVPEWCYLPLKYVRRYSFDEQSCTNADILVGAYAWLKFKACFSFDQTLYDSLVNNTDDMKKIPINVLTQMPAPSVYIDLKDDDFSGVLAYLDFDFSDETDVQKGKGEYRRSYLVLTPIRMSEDGIVPLSSVSVPLLNMPIEEVWKDERNFFYNSCIGVAPFVVIEKAFQDMVALFNRISYVIPLLLYLCTERPDITKVTKRGRTAVEKIKTSPQAVRWDVGVRIGTALRLGLSRASDDDGEVEEDTKDSPVKRNRSPKAHIRRAHWHHFWVGKKDSNERKLVLRWMPPISVMIDNLENLPTTIRLIK